MQENPELSQLVDYAVEYFRRIAEELGVDECERFIEEYPILTDTELRDFQILARDVVPEVDYVVGDYLYKGFAHEIGVATGSSLDPSEFNVDQVCFHLLNALRGPLSTKLRQELPECPGEPLDAEIGALVQSGYTSMKSAKFAISLANQLPFNLTKEAILFCDRSDVKDAFDAAMKEARVKVASVAGETFAKSVDVEIDDLATFEENVSQKSREDQDKANHYALLHCHLYRAWINSHIEEILESDRLLAALQKTYASFDELADRYNLVRRQEYLNAYPIFRKKKVVASLESLNGLFKGRAQSGAPTPR